MWENVGLAIKVALDFGVNPKVIKKTVPNIQFEGRVQFVRGKLTKNLKKNERLLLDGCHSDESTKNLAQYLRKFKAPIYGICGIQKNKNPNQLIKNFKGILKKIVTIKIPNEPNAMSSSDLRRIALRHNFETVESDNIKDALKKISTKEKKTIIIFGSLYLVGNALSMN